MHGWQANTERTCALPVVFRAMPEDEKGAVSNAQMLHLRQLFFERMGLSHQRKRKSLIFEAKKGMTKKGYQNPRFRATIGNVGNLFKRRLAGTNPVLFFLFSCDCKVFLCSEQRQEGKTAFPHFVSLLSKIV